MKINAPFVEKILTKFIKEELSKFDFSRGILGLSGGLDSTVCAFLASKALDPDSVICLIMPYRDTFGRDIDDALDVVRFLGIRSKVVNISPMVDSYFKLALR